MKKYLYFYIVSIILLVNDALANMLGLFTGFTPWRQSIWIIGVWAMYNILKSNKILLPNVSRIVKQYYLLVILVAILSLFTILLGEVSIVRVLMSIIEYFYGL